MSDHEDEESLLSLSPPKKGTLWKAQRHSRHLPRWDPVYAVIIGLVMLLLILLTLVYWIVFPARGGGFSLPKASPCDTIDKGYQCDPQISHLWGQYSPYYAVDSEIPSKPPDHCDVTFAQLLSRHGARYPTLDKSRKYNNTIAKVQAKASNFSGPYAFLQHCSYDLGADGLTTFGQQEMVKSGIDFFTRYESLAGNSTPFIRASGEDRVVASAQKWMNGFHRAKIASGATNDTDYPFPITIISEEAGMNNTLNHGTCLAFETSKTGSQAQDKYSATFVPAITARLSSAMGLGGDFTDADTIALMDMCPFTTVAESTFQSTTVAKKRGNTMNSPTANPFCALFTPLDWQKYDYYQTLGKYYGSGPGSPLGPTQGVGFANELTARLTSTPVNDSTTVNHTMDSDPASFPLERTLYADFSHDNAMTSIFAALELFSSTPRLSISELMTPDETQGYAVSRTVPFAGRMVVEKLRCSGAKEEMVRVIVNGRVLPLGNCKGDELGRCTLADFIKSLGFAETGGLWDQCSAMER